MAMNSYLRYVDENDRAYGVTGMTIAMVLWEGEQYIAAVNLDSPVGGAIEFTPAFGFSGNPRVTASVAWHEMRKQFKLLSAMIMGNAFCRAFVGASNYVPGETIAELRQVLRREGSETCDLSDDEVDMIYNEAHRYLERVFTHSQINSIARNFAASLMERRSLSPGDVFELLREIR